jgi:hypothetical protein
MLLDVPKNLAYLPALKETTSNKFLNKIVRENASNRNPQVSQSLVMQPRSLRSTQYLDSPIEVKFQTIPNFQN